MWDLFNLVQLNCLLVTGFARWLYFSNDAGKEKQSKRFFLGDLKEENINDYSLSIHICNKEIAKSSFFPKNIWINDLFFYGLRMRFMLLDMYSRLTVYYIEFATGMNFCDCCWGRAGSEERAAGDKADTELCHPDPSSRKAVLPSCGECSQQTAPGCQLLQAGRGCLCHFTQGHALPRTAWIQWPRRGIHVHIHFVLNGETLRSHTCSRFPC